MKFLHNIYEKYLYMICDIHIINQHFLQSRNTFRSACTCTRNSPSPFFMKVLRFSCDSMNWRTCLFSLKTSMWSYFDLSNKFQKYTGFDFKKGTSFSVHTTHFFLIVYVWNLFNKLKYEQNKVWHFVRKGGKHVEHSRRVIVRWLLFDLPSHAIGEGQLASMRHIPLMYN